MVSNKSLVSALATLASLAVVNAGPCKPKTYATDTTSATFASASSVPSSLSSETNTVPSVTIETSTSTADSEITTTTTENGTTMTVSVSVASTTTAGSETSTEASESETTGVATGETTAVTSSAEATTVVSSTEITTVATTTEGSSTVAETTATTTTAAAGPTELLVNGNFDLGTVSPWLTATEPAVRLGSNDPFEGQAYGELEYYLVDDEGYNNYVYQPIDTSRLKAGSYALSARLRVDSASNSLYDDGCNSMAVGCAFGDPNMLNYVQNSFVTVSPYVAVNQWYLLTTTCSFDEQDLADFDSVSVVIGFSCANAVAAVDAVVFQESK
ncbi:hypothetical protein HG530_013068 [Fusarium avenaceum]|nr:hypothetical protein HG530_013068 [Fusarium avenaceum]KIL84615.1 hypothetical protein FAVG1_12142 [Fusarium avenaceum]